MENKRVKRLNSLLREVISEVINKDVHNPNIAEFTSVTSVDISADLQNAKVYISVIGSDEDREKTVAALQTAAGFISVLSSKKVTMRYFPSLLFKEDKTADHYMKIESILQEINEKNPKDSDDSYN